MKIIEQAITKNDLGDLAKELFGDFVKAVVDIERKMMAVDAELHADLEAFLLENGARQQDLWGINIFPDKTEPDWIEFDSMINIRPTQGNRSRGVEDEAIRSKIVEVVRSLVS